MERVSPPIPRAGSSASFIAIEPRDFPAENLLGKKKTIRVIPIHNSVPSSSSILVKLESFVGIIGHRLTCSPGLQ